MTAMRFERIADGPDALPMGTKRPTHAYTGGDSIDCTEHGTSYERELYRTRVLSHLYDERDVIEAERTRAMALAAMAPGLVDRCCHTCQHAIVTRSAAHPCPYCGSHRLSQPV